MSIVYQIVSAQRTDRGRKRAHNEDWVAFFEPNDADELQASGNLYIVADGVGGASKGERASQYAAQMVLYEYYQNPDLNSGERLRRAMRQASKEIHEFARENTPSGRMATTMVAAVVRGQTLTVANVGDSRAYLVRKGVAQQITHDHSYAGEMVRNGTLSEEKASQIKGKNKLTRSLGGEADVSVDVFPDIPLKPGDCILMCSDGLTRYTSREEISAITSNGSPEQIVDRFVNLANERGGVDNISVILIHVDQQVSLSDSTPIAPRGQLPGPVDWETVVTGTSKETESNKYWFVSGMNRYIVFGIAAICCMLLGGLLGTLLISRLIDPETSQITRIETASVPPVITANGISSGAGQITSTVSSTPTSLITQESISTLVVTPTNFISPTQNIVQNREEICVIKVVEGQGLDYHLDLFGMTQESEIKYFYYLNCDNSQTTTICSGKGEVEPPDYVLSVYWWLQIPGVSKEECAVAGLWAIYQGNNH